MTPEFFTLAEAASHLSRTTAQPVAADWLLQFAISGKIKLYFIARRVVLLEILNITEEPLIYGTGAHIEFPANALEWMLGSLESPRTVELRSLQTPNGLRQVKDTVTGKQENLVIQENDLRVRVSDLVHLRQANSARPTPPTVKAPDWSFWRVMRKADDWQACALSLNIDPDSLERHPQAWMAGPDSGALFTADSFPSKDSEEKFGKRFRLLHATRYDRNIFTLPMAKGSGLGQSEIFLAEFAAWGASIGWDDMPPQLAELAQQPAPQVPSPLISADEWSALVQQEEDARQDPAYRAKYDHAWSLYDERDKLLENLRQDHPYKNPEIVKRLSEIRQELEKPESEKAAPFTPDVRAVPVKAEQLNTHRTRIEPQGGDSLTPTIWTICYGLKEAGKRITARPVMAELKMRAAEKLHPIVSTTAGGIKYEYERGDERELNAENLRKRIEEWKAKTGG